MTSELTGDRISGPTGNSVSDQQPDLYPKLLTARLQKGSLRGELRGPPIGGGEEDQGLVLDLIPSIVSAKVQDSAVQVGDRDEERGFDNPTVVELIVEVVPVLD